MIEKKEYITLPDADFAGVDHQQQIEKIEEK